MNIAVLISIWAAGTSSVNLNNYFMTEPLAFLKTNRDVIAELSADGQNFKEWGYSSHHSMHRENFIRVNKSTDAHS